MSIPSLFPLLIIFTQLAFSTILLTGQSPSIEKPSSFYSKLADIDKVVDRAIRQDGIPGAVVLIGYNGTTIFEKAYGYRSLRPEIEPMTIDTKFDLASLTKVVATTPAIMLLEQNGKLQLKDPVAKYLPEFGQFGKQDVTYHQILTHYSGLPPFFQLPKNDPFTKNQLFNKIYNITLLSKPGEEFIYSDLGFILLGKVIEKKTGQPFEHFIKMHFFSPLKMSNTGFLPCPKNYRLIAPTERLTAGMFIRGKVHDPIAAFLGGVAGHAGIFSTARDLARFCQMLLNEGFLDGKRVLNVESVKKMISRQSPLGKKNIRGLGWDIQSAYSSLKGSYFSPDSYGHTGFTGTSLWIDPNIQTFVILLTNRVHPNGKGSVRNLRKRLANIVGKTLSSEQETF